jgi:hypothetical protein
VRAIVAVAISATLAGCAASKPMGWARIDGTALTSQFEVDKTVCNGEVAKADLGTPPTDSVGRAYRQGQALAQVRQGCMAQHGYMLIELEPQSPKP